MPVYEFDEIIPNPAYQESLKLRDNGQAAYLEEPAWKQRINYWGFGDGETYYMAPKAAYAKDPQHADRELKLLIRQLHKNGIEIILQMYFFTALYAGIYQGSAPILGQLLSCGWFSFVWYRYSDAAFGNGSVFKAYKS